MILNKGLGKSATTFLSIPMTTTMKKIYLNGGVKIQIAHGIQRRLKLWIMAMGLHPAPGLIKVNLSKGTNPNGVAVTKKTTIGHRMETELTIKDSILIMISSLEVSIIEVIIKKIDIGIMMTKLKTEDIKIVVVGQVLRGISNNSNSLSL